MDSLCYFLPDFTAHAVVSDLAPLPSEVAFDKLTMSAFVGSYLDLALRHAADLGYVPVQR
ncbi:isochorismatase family protein [Gloeocapsopsis sp. IPPAS B-1203]|uniref:isochorismatase family protein n=1 Tax=Gloeocapsopsis sp. IPPAS B-1203 TaxID=2049454 RepID=UPI0025A2CE6D|nr:isochorismatase family protein [Gloeocapsopsis sp. IPPAS B-1203]